MISCELQALILIRFLSFSLLLLTYFSQAQGVYYEDYSEEDEKDLALPDSLSYPYFGFYLGFEMGIPVGEFKSQSHSLDAYGADLSANYHWSKKSPIYAGLGFSLLHYGRSNFTQEYNVSGDLFDIDSNMDHMIAFPYLTVGLQQKRRKVNPILEVFAGPRFFVSRLSARLDEEIDFSENQQSDWSFAYGVKAGIFWKVRNRIYIEAKLHYIEGTQTTYSEKRDFDFDPDTQTFQLLFTESKTNMVALDFGVRFLLD